MERGLGIFYYFDRTLCAGFSYRRAKICLALQALRVFSGQFDVLLVSLGHPGGLV